MNRLSQNSQVLQLHITWTFSAPNYTQICHIVKEILENSIIPLERNEVKQDRMEQTRIE